METNLKITIDQLKYYLGTGLKIEPDGKSAAEKNILVGLYQDPCLSVDAVYFGTIDGQDIRTIDGMRPICHRLSDLDKFIPELGFVPIEEFLKIEHLKWYEEHKGSRYESITVDQVPNYVKAFFTYMATLDIRIWKTDIANEPYWILQKLFQWHFWPFGEEYFEQGLVIDKLKQGKEVSNA
jgi:hypothetical protein